jgi:hypothetical protein
MKYVKKFDQIYENNTDDEKLIRKTKKAAVTTVTLESILRTFFALFMDVNAIKQIWSARKEEKKLMELSIDIYKHLIDMGDIIDLPKEQQLKYAQNLGIEVNKDTNVISEISKQLYIQNYKRDFEEDLEKVIEYLEKESRFESFKEIQKIFLDEIKKIQHIL